MKALLSHDQTAIWPRLCLRDDFWPTKKVGICCPNATVSGNIINNTLLNYTFLKPFKKGNICQSGRGHSILITILHF